MRTVDVSLLLFTFLLVACGGGPPRYESVARMESAGVGVGALRGETRLPAQAGEANPSSDDALMAMGAQLYSSNCAPCHHPNGEGNLSIFPALNRNAFVTVSDPTAVIDTVLHGRGVMPAFHETLSAQDVAAVISYIRNTWNNQASVVDAEAVRDVREGQESR